MATELAAAYVTIIPSLKGASKSIESALSGVNTSSVGKSLGDGVTSSMLPSFSTLAKTAMGVLAGIGSAKILQGGISRALKLDQAEMKFEAMGINVEQAMKSCNEAVTGTAYGLDAAATVAASLGASGIEAGDQMTSALKAVAGMSAMSGVSMEHMGVIFGKVAAQGRVQGDELTQLAENGVNATAALAKYLGVTQQEVREMTRKGEIDFQTFADAMYATFGDAAQGANETFSGAMANVNAAISRITAKFASPALEGLRKVFVATIPALDAVSKLLDPLVEKFAALVDTLSGGAVTAIEAFTNALSNGGSIIDGFKAAFDSLPDKAQDVALVLAGIAGALGAGAIASKIAALGGAVAGFGPKIAGFGSKIAGISTKVVGFGTKLPIVGGMFTKLASKMNVMGSAVTLCGGGFKGFAAVLGGVLTGPVGIVLGVIAALAAGFAYLWKTSEPFKAQMTELGSQIMSSLQPSLQLVMDTLSNMAATVMPVITQAIQTIVPVIAQVIQSVVDVMAVIIPVIAQVVATVVPVIAQIISLIVKVAAAIIDSAMPVITMILEFVKAAMPQIQQIIETAMNLVKQIIETVWPIIEEIIVKVMDVVLNIIETAWPAIQSAIELAMSVIEGVIDTVWPMIEGIIDAAMSVIQGIIDAGMAIMQGDWSGAWDIIKNALSDAWESIKTGVTNGISALMSALGEIPGKITNFFANAGSWLLDAGSRIIGGLIDGIKGAIGGLGDALGGIGDFIVQHKGPPSYDARMLIPNGELIMGSLVKGIANGVPALEKTLAGVTSDVQGLAAEVSPFDDVNANVKTWRNVEFSGEKTGIDDVIDLLQEYLPGIAEEKGVYLNEHTLVGKLAKPMNKELGKLNRRAGALC